MKKIDRSNTTKPGVVNRTVGFFPLQEYGHILPSLKLANRFKQDGYSVVYVIEERFVDLMKRMGFEYVVFDSTVFKNRPKDTAHRSENRFIKGFRDGMKLAEGILDKIQCDAIMIDILASRYGLAALQRGIPISTYQTTMDIELHFHKPHSSGIILGSHGSRLREFAAWIWSTTRDEAGFSGELKEYRLHLKECFRPYGVKTQWGRQGFSSFHVNPVVFGPRALSYRRLNSDRYFGLCRAPVGSMLGCHVDASVFQDRHWIYCSFGTYSSRYKSAPALLIEIVRFFQEQTSLGLILQTGLPIDETWPVSDRERIIVAPFFDNDWIISRVEGVIFHGGYGTFKDCVAHRKPMLAIPFDHDQPGVSSRAVELGVGQLLGTRDRSRRAVHRRLRVWVDRLGDKLDWPPIEADEEEFECAYRSLCSTLKLQND